MKFLALFSIALLTVASGFRIRYFNMKHYIQDGEAKYGEIPEGCTDCIELNQASVAMFQCLTQRNHAIRACDRAGDMKIKYSPLQGKICPPQPTLGGNQVSIEEVTSEPQTDNPTA